MKDKNNNPTRDREARRAQLTAQLNDRQRQLNEISDRARHCETIVRECREQLDDGRDKSHIRWLIPTLLLTLGGLFLLSIHSRVLAWVCLVLAVISFFRWIAAFSHSLRKYGRIAKRLRHNISECDKLSDRSSALRLETLELRQELEKLERDS